MKMNVSVSSDGFNEITYRGFKIVEEEDCYTLYEIGKKKRRDYQRGKAINNANIAYQDEFAKMRYSLDYIYQYINNFIKERKKDPAYEDNVITLLNKL